MTSIGWIGPSLVLAGAGALLWLAYRSGRKAERGESAARAAEVKDEQLKVDRPSRGDVHRRLRDGNF